MFHPKRSTRATSPIGLPRFFHELAMARGPAAIGAVGDGSYQHLYGTTWLLELHAHDHLLRLYRWDGGAWTQITADLPPLFDAPMPPDTRRISLAFDQAARVTVAWETGGMIRATRWDAMAGVYAQDVTFAGTNPVLLMDASVARRIPDSDIILWYQRPADMRLIVYRLQRDHYGVENIHFTHTAPLILDQALALHLRYQLLASDAHGDPIRAASVIEALRSAPYPYYHQLQALAGSGRFIGGEYRAIEHVSEHQPLRLIGAGRFASGDYFMPVILYNHQPLRITGSGRFASGNYQLIVTNYDHHPLRVTGSGRFASGNYQHIATQYTHNPAVITGSGRFIGGNYAPA